MILQLKRKKIYSELEHARNNRSMQRDLIRNLCHNGQDFFFLNCYRMECNYLHLTPIVGLPKIWKVTETLNNNIKELYEKGFLNENEKSIAHDIAETLIYVMKQHRLLLFVCSLFHPL